MDAYSSNLTLCIPKPVPSPLFAVVLFQEVLRGEDWPVLRLAWLVHWDAVSRSSGGSPGLPLWTVHSGALPGQVNTPPLSLINTDNIKHTAASCICAF